jgi:hypothetical protein
MKASAVFALLLTLPLLCAADPPPLKLNQVQVLGTHNSYRIRPPAALWQFLQKLPARTGAGNPADLDYAHPPLPDQFEAGAHSIELDLYADPQGGRFVKRMGMALTSEPVEAPEPERTELSQPGTKILHVPDIDFGTTCHSLRTALSQIKTWSEAHPQHLPVFVLLETKDETVKQKLPLPGLTEAAPWDAAACETLDAEIREVLDESKVFRPDQLRGAHPTLEAAALAGAWPSLDAMRGKVLFVMEGVAPETYAAGRPSLAGRWCFIYGEPGRAETAFLILNDAVRQRETIARRVREGYMVRTRADSGTREARSGKTTRRDAAFASGAHIISSDYLQPDARGGKEPGWTTYKAVFPGGGTARPNPVTAHGFPVPILK